MRTFPRVIGALAMLAIAAFCVFGFLASFEPSDAPRLPWKIGYAALGIGCQIAAVRLLRTTVRRSR